MTDIKFIGTNQVELVNSLNENDKLPSFDTGEDFIEFKFTDPLSNNDVDYYHFVITGSNVQVSGVIDSVSKKQEFCNLFKGCTQITDASNLILSAPTMKESCYANMFIDCTNLTTPPQIQAQTLDMWCFQNMFAGCEKLSAAPVLSATTLAPYCYYAMFYGCKSLSTSPYLPAETLTDWCYNSMFYNCQKLNYISANFSSWGENATTNWVTNVAEDGYFENQNISYVYGVDNVPEGWKIDYSALPLTFKGKAATNAICLSTFGSPDAVELKYNKNDTGWTAYTIGDVIELNQNDKVKISGANDHFSKNNDNFYQFKMSGIIEAYGNIQSLMNFSNSCTSACYKSMFAGCTALTAAPALPATGLAIECYQTMFFGCSSLSTAPVLSATTLNGECYKGMFERCTSLTAAPALPATTLAHGCYSNMFDNCTSLTAAPALPATGLATNCYQSMFANCSNLKQIEVYFTHWGTATDGWVNGVAANGTFTKPSGLVEEFSRNRIPSGWTVVNK